jgi:ribonuclease D
VKLDKGPQKADWAQRPLTPRMETYARNDTRYLKTLEEKLRAELTAKGRLAWHQESCARLIAESSVPPVIDPDDIWRIKGSTFLESPALAVLRELWHWRETEADRREPPAVFCVVARDDDCAGHRRGRAAAVRATNSCADAPAPPGTSAGRHPRRAGRAAGTVPRKNPHRSQRPTEAEFKRFRVLEKNRDHHAHGLQIDPTLIAPKSVLGDLARDWDKHAPELMNWQRALLKVSVTS